MTINKVALIITNIINETDEILQVETYTITVMEVIIIKEETIILLTRHVTRQKSTRAVRVLYRDLHIRLVTVKP